MSGNSRILDRLFAALDLFEQGKLPLAELQAAVLANGEALEGAGAHWRELINRAEGQLDMVRFSVAMPKQHAAAMEHIQQLRHELAKLRGG